MFKIIEDLPEDVVGIEAAGKLTHEDYTGKLIPLLNEALKKHDKVKLLYVIGPEFDGFELAALWDDTSYGLHHWHDVSHIAMVTEENWIRAMMAMFAPLFPGEVRIFGLSEIGHAKEWISNAHHKAAA